MKSSERYVCTTKLWDDPLELMTVFHRVVERNRLTQALRESDLLGGLVGHLPEGICLLDAARRVTLANPTAQECLYALAGKGVGEILTHLGERPIDEILAEVLLTAHDGLTCEVKAPDSPRVFEISARQIASQSTLGEWVMVVREATSHREAQGRMQQQERLASMGQRALGVAHAFNNLLAVIVSIAQLLERRPDASAEGREMLRSLVSQGRQSAPPVGQPPGFSHNKRHELPEAEIPRGNREVILVVENQILVRETAKAMLEYLNYRVITVRNGWEALKSYRAHRDKIALVLTYMAVAEMGGKELAEILNESNPKIPVMVGMLQKPLILEKLAQVISKAIQSRSTRPG